MQLRGIGSVPSTSMAAHAADELVEFEGDDKIEVVDTVPVAAVEENASEVPYFSVLVVWFSGQLLVSQKSILKQFHLLL